MKLFQSSFFRHFMTIFSGGVVAQLISFLVEPVLTRIYTPEEFALFAQFISITTIFSVIATARYELAIMLPSNHRGSINILALSVLISFFVGILVLLLLILFGDKLVFIYQTDKLLVYLWIAPFSVFIAGVTQALNYWMLRYEQFKTISFGRVVQSASNATGNVGLGILKWSTWGLIVSYLVGQLVSFFVFLRTFLKKDYKALKLVQKGEMKSMAKEYSDFPKINTWHAFTDIFQQSLVIMLLSYFFTAEDVGYYSRTYRLLIAPLTLIGSSMGQVFFHRASKYVHEHQNLRSFVVKNLLFISALAIPLFLLIIFFAPYLFEWFLGKGWDKAGVMAQYMAPWLMFTMIVSPMSTLPLVLHRQKTAFLFSLIGNSLIILSIFVGGNIGHGIYLSLGIVSISMSLYFIILLGWYLKISSALSK